MDVSMYLVLIKITFFSKYKMLDLTRIQKQDRSPTCSTILRNNCLFYKINNFGIVNNTGASIRAVAISKL